MDWLDDDGSTSHSRVSKYDQLMNILKRLCPLSLLCLCAAAPGHAQDLSKFFRNTAGAFVLYDLKNNRYLRHNPARCKQRLTPHSTFKIPNSLIGLETGVIADADFVIPWDRQKYPPETALSEEWNRDHNLRSAIKYSVVWYYRELAKRVGEARMKKMVQALRYGNQDISGGIDRFWLNSSLTISADEEVEFLKRFYCDQAKLAAPIASNPMSREALGLIARITLFLPQFAFVEE